jgi:hypothetical protein
VGPNSGQEGPGAMCGCAGGVIYLDPTSSCSRGNDN